MAICRLREKRRRGAEVLKVLMIRKGSSNFQYCHIILIIVKIVEIIGLSSSLIYPQFSFVKCHLSISFYVHF